MFNNNKENWECKYLTLLLAIQGICLIRQTYFLSDFNILVQIMPAGWVWNYQLERYFTANFLCRVMKVWLSTALG